MKIVTLAQIVLAGQGAANKAVIATADGAQPDALAIQSIKLEEFAATGFERPDFGAFENAFNAQLEMLASFSRQDSPATKAAKLAETLAQSPATH